MKAWYPLVFGFQLGFFGLLLSDVEPHKYRQEQQSPCEHGEEQQSSVLTKLWKSMMFIARHLLLQSNMCCLIPLLISICCLF